MIKINQDLIDFILQNYDLGQLLNSPEKLTGGLTNNSYKLNTNKEIVVVKILNSVNNHRITELEFSEQINELAYNEGIKTLPAIKVNDKFIQNYKNINFIVYKYYDGRVILSKELDLEKCKMLARELAKIHKLDTSKIKIPNTSQIYDKKINFSFYYEKLKNIDEDWAIEFKNKFRTISQIYDKSYEAYKKLSNQKTFTHKDLNRLNVLWKNNDFVIIDWENATFSNPSIDFFSSAWFLTDDVKEDKYEVFAKEYFKNFKFQDSIETVAYAGIIDEIIWLEFNLKRSLGMLSNNKNEIELGKTQIKSPITEIINYHSKIDKMIEICNSELNI